MLSFANAPGNLFNRLGKLAALIKNVNSYQATQLASLTNTTTGVVAQYNGESDIQALIGAAYIAQLSGPESVCSLAQQVAQSTVNRMVFRDLAQYNQNLQQYNIVQSISEVIRQMKLAGATILNMTLGSSVNPFIGTGNGVLNVSTKRPLDGLVLENAFAETLTFTCTQDSYTGAATPFNEQFAVTGQGAEPDLFAFDWPLGSNCSIPFSAIDGDTSNGAGNLLTNSGFASWTNGLPNNFAVSGGSILSQETGQVFGGNSALKLTGDGATTVTLQQQFNASSGTLGRLSPQQQLSFAIWLRTGPSAPGTGSLTVSLVDQNGTVLKDNAAALNTATFGLTGLTQVYTPFTVVFRTPTILPASAFLQAQFTPVTNTVPIYADKMSVGLMSQCYTSGPFVALHSGSVPFVLADYANASITNSRGAGGTLNTWQTALFRLLAPYIVANEFLFPSSSVPSVPDTLIA